ncbi:hypothetical protein [Micromonospora sp. NPDC047730]|uniref:hypothetical protein n=1 Tax=Micromonospora sp. NPDC047730 TaxID=3364253 RepID=UPI003710E3E6
MSGFGGMEMRRYSPFAPDEVHADMRANPGATLRAMTKNPAVVEAHRDCSTCAELTSALTPETSRRAKVTLSMPQLANALRLPPGTRAVRMYVTNDPHLLHLVVEGEHLDEVPLTAQTPLLQP